MKYDFFLIVIGLMFMIISLLYVFKKKYSEGFVEYTYVNQLTPDNNINDIINSVGNDKRYNYSVIDMTQEQNKALNPLFYSTHPQRVKIITNPDVNFNERTDANKDKYQLDNRRGSEPSFETSATLDPTLKLRRGYSYQFTPKSYMTSKDNSTSYYNTDQEYTINSNNSATSTYICNNPVKYLSKENINETQWKTYDIIQYNKKYNFITADGYTGPTYCIPKNEYDLWTSTQLYENIDFKVKTIKFVVSKTLADIRSIQIFNENNVDVLASSPRKYNVLTSVPKLDSIYYNYGYLYPAVSRSHTYNTLLIFDEPIIITKIYITTQYITSGVDANANTNIAQARANNERDGLNNQTLKSLPNANIVMDFYDGELSLLTLNTPNTAINTYHHITDMQESLDIDGKNSGGYPFYIISNFTYKQSPTSKNNTLNEIISTIDASYSEVKNTLTNINTINDEIVAKLQILDKNTSCSRTSENNLKIEEAKQLINTLKTDVDNLKNDIQSQYTALFGAINHIKQKTPIKFTTDDTLNTLNCTDEPELTIIKNESNNKEIKLGFKLPGKDIGIRGKTGKYGEKGSSGTGGLPGENGLPGYWGTK